MKKKKKTAMEMSMGYLTQKMRTENEVRRYLNGKEFEETQIDETIDRLKAYGFIEDLSYAKRFIETHPSSGKRMLNQKLRQRGISADTLSQALGEVSPEQEGENAYLLLQKKLKGETGRENMQKAMQSVMRRGFSYEAVKSAVMRINNQIDLED